MKIKPLATAISSLAALGMALAAPMAHGSAEALIRAKCLPCHTEADDGISRISHQRKTPEGWLMSVARMQIMHGLKITD